MSGLTLSESESRSLVAEFGVEVSGFIEADSVEAVRSAADDLTYPVVAKLCGRAIAHKTERGLVRLALATPDALVSAAEELLAAARPEDGQVSVLVSNMVDGNRELIAGVVRDPQFGPVVMLGIGGILAEAIGDVTFRLAPLDPIDAEEMIDDLRSQALLGELRGEPAVDRAALAAVLTGLGRLAAERPDIVSVDCNPLIVNEGRPIAVDALVELESEVAA